ncbi:MAG: hypothetical protein WKF75_12340 [Singulisphaera sp.]
MRRRSSTVLGCSGTKRWGGSCPGSCTTTCHRRGADVSAGFGGRRIVGPGQPARPPHQGRRQDQANGAVDLTMITSPLVE